MTAVHVTDLGHGGPQGEPPATTPSVAADSEGRAGFPPAPGAVPFTLPKPLGLPRFGAGPQDPPDPKPVPNPHPYPPPHAA